MGPLPRALPLRRPPRPVMQTAPPSSMGLPYSRRLATAVVSWTPCGASASVPRRRTRLSPLS
eukprot:12332111-Alexandrium_andersonii.AAC.1